jgi:hydrogenase-4 component F
MTMVAMLLLVMMIAPAVAAIGCLVFHRAAVAEYLNLIASIVVLAAALPLVVLSSGGPYRFWGDYIIVDTPGAWITLCTAVVYFLASVYAVGYMRLLKEEAERLWGFYALFAGFALTVLASTVMNNAGLYWIAIELTTLVSTFLVGFERAAESVEAAWKYIIIVSAGISLALLGTVLFYWCGSFVLGPVYDMTWSTLQSSAPKMNSTLISLAYLLVLVGYGTKVGFAPMHTWLPDAHSESPAPVSAMLSGALLNGAMLGIVRYLAICDAAGIGPFARTVLVAFGVFSLLVASLFIVRQSGIKRLMAYSSVEHMGVVALGFGFGGVFGVAGALYHVLNHSLNKSLMFFGAGNVMRSYGTKEIGKIRGVWRQNPVNGSLWLAGAAAITGAPPFGLFLSELIILRGGIEQGYSWAVAIMIVLLIVIFIGFLNHFRKMYFQPEPPSDLPPSNIGGWCLTPMWFALAPLLLFGLWWPTGLWEHFSEIARILASSSP